MVGGLAAIIVVGLGACTEQRPPSPASTSQSTTAGGAVRTAPAVDEPISLGELWKSPCGLIKAFKLEDYGFGDEDDGKPYPDGSGSACVWTATNGAGSGTATLVMVAYPDHDILGETYRTAPADATAFKPSMLTLPRLPAVYVADTATSCSYVVGFSATQGIKVTYTAPEAFEEPDIKKRCAIPYSAAAGVVSMIRPPRSGVPTTR
ncbi:DUF3558 family protein [Actinokineospora xionganensis]|uniref:DUF3558 family protein n=1 Tax=Actinokineospora xionganensis TaxID=2684470 RepID=A0ABR7LFW1_9PSEU|nr:DUF3558 family protein [Actinokineospora xionganensis]MBC6451535.1 DUF3558 family protein [Actinokineospora xionganensis]